MMLRQDLQAVLARLPHPTDRSGPRDAYGQVLWENIGYLIDDHRRHALFTEFSDRIGLAPQAILEADEADLHDIASRGGMRPEVRVGRWRQIAEITLGPGGGDLDRMLRALPLHKARALLKLYPAIGDPCADKILLFAGISPRPSLESNGVRTLVRMGFIQEHKAYAATWRAAMDVLREQGEPDFDWLTGAYLTLRDHGRERCRCAEPACPACPLDFTCAHAPASG